MHAADEPDPPVSRHAPHAAASGQDDRWAPSVSRPATGSSSSPRQPHLSTEPRPKQHTRAQVHTHRMTLFPTLAPRPRNHPRAREPSDALSASPAAPPSAMDEHGARPIKGGPQALALHSPRSHRAVHTSTKPRDERRRRGMEKDAATRARREEPPARRTASTSVPARLCYTISTIITAPPPSPSSSLR